MKTGKKKKLRNNRNQNYNVDNNVIFVFQIILHSFLDISEIN